MRAFFFCLISMLLWPAPAHADRVKEMGQFQGVRSNQLTGYGVVVGLAGILRQLIGSMRSAKLADEMFGSNATSQFYELADARTAESMTTMRQFGIADLVEKQLIQTKGPPDA